MNNPQGRRMNAKNQLSIPNEAVIYAFAHTETWLEDYARSHKLPAYELTQRVAGLLYGAAGGQVLGIVDHVPTLRRASAQGDSPARKVALVERPHRKAQGKVTCRACSRTLASRKAYMRHMYREHPEETAKWRKKAQAALSERRAA